MQTKQTIEQYVDSVPWIVLGTAYGTARPLRRFLLNLYHGTPEEMDDAIAIGLWGHAIHQYSVYTGTIFVVPAVVICLRDGHCHDPRNVLAYLDECIKKGTRFLQWSVFPQFPWCSPLFVFVRVLQLPFLFGVGLPSLEIEIPKARKAFEELSSSENPDIRSLAESLLKFCDRVRNASQNSTR